MEQCRTCRRGVYPTQDAAAKVAVRNEAKHGRTYRTVQCPTGGGWHFVDAHQPPGVDSMTSGEVADLYAVTTQTVDRWADEGRLPKPVLTLGGHRRFDRAAVHAQFEAAYTPAAAGARR